jgi:hypothetical protein
MAIENIIGIDVRRRVLLTMLFGLVHGFGFSYGLQEELQFAGPHLIVSLFAFNVGSEIGQILALAVMLPVLTFITRHILTDRVGTIVLSAFSPVGWHWMSERWKRYRACAGRLSIYQPAAAADLGQWTRLPPAWLSSRRLPLEPLPLRGGTDGGRPVSGE